MDMKTLPGTLWLNRGRWNWRVKLPGDTDRKNYPLRPPNHTVALPKSKRDLAESVAWRMWEKASRESVRVGALGAAGISVDEACGRFMAHAETYYRRPDGSQTREATNCELALRVIRSKYGDRPLDDIAYQDVLAARDGMIASGLTRGTINQRVGIWRRFAAWALENRLCSPQTKSEITALGNLKRGRCEAPESDPVTPVRHRDVKAALQFMPANLAAMVRVQELCGARPGEMCAMRPCDIERRRSAWVYRPAQHKTAHKGNIRIVVLGPRAVKILRRVLDGAPVDARLFSPAASVRERGMVKGHEKAHASWTASNYAQAVRYAIAASRKAGHDIEEWSPNQLRHSCGTRVRRKFGPGAASAVLGHSLGGARVTNTYTSTVIEREIIAAASRPMLRLG
jgi:integrase